MCPPHARSNLGEQNGKAIFSRHIATHYQPSPLAQKFFADFCMYCTSIGSAYCDTLLREQQRLREANCKNKESLDAEEPRFVQADSDPAQPRPVQ